jgi:4-amino-4-deoxy-L-arabinose transferase-like glycosyltransferase
MLGILLVINLMAFIWAAYSVRGRLEYLRESILVGFLCWGSALLAATEVLSLFHAIGFWQILFFWIVMLVSCVIFISFHPPKSSAGDTMGPWSFLEQVSFNRIVFFSFCLGVIALFAPPSTYDAMSYHMSRVMHWIQDRSLMYYPTNISLQLIYPIFSESVILHFQLLSGSDRWANSVQWLAMCGSLVGVSLIARELGASRKGQILSALIAMTIPMGILQATSTQTDYVDTLWLCSFIYFFFCWRRALGWGYALLIGASLGLDLATKGVALIYAAPFLGVMLVEAFRRMKIKKLFMMAAVVVLLASLYYAGIFYRNTLYFHGHADKFTSLNDSLLNTPICLEAFGANVLRNLGIHLVTPWFGLNTSINQEIYHVAAFLHINLNNKDWSFFSCIFQPIHFSANEDCTGNLLHVLFFSIVLILLAFPRFRNRDTVHYLAACLLGYLAFNVLLKWQPYHSRFHLGMFVIFSPLAGFVIERIKFKWIISSIMGILFFTAWLMILINVNKPILGSISIFYPEDRPFLHFIRVEASQPTYLEYASITQVLKKLGCKNIGLIMGPGDLEYLLWTALNPASDPSIRIESIFVSNASSTLKYPRGDFVPDAIIALNDDRPWVSLGNNMYQVVWSSASTGKKISILLKNPA